MTNIVVVCQEEHEKGYEDYVGVCLLCEIERAVLEEREACAKLADVWVRAYDHPSEAIANSIRERSNHD